MKISIKNALAALTFLGTLAIALPVTAQTGTACPDFGYLKAGDQNNADQVSNLQTFLKNRENLDVDVTGYFDEKTEQAVKAFQKKYMGDIMGPWNATRASGVVNLTTVKKVKQLLCGEPLTLNARELMAISSYNENGGSASVSIAAATNSDGSVSLGPVSKALAATEGDDQTAAASEAPVGASLWHRFGSFLKHIFGR
jgi:hypothetical protein